MFSFVRSYNFGWSPVYDCKAYLETNTVQNCSYFGLVDIFLVSGTIKHRVTILISRVTRSQQKLVYLRYLPELNCFISVKGIDNTNN